MSTSALSGQAIRACPAKMLALASGAADRVFSLIDRYHIESDARHDGWLQPAHTPRALAMLEKRANAWLRRGASVEILDREQTARALGTTYYHGGWIDRLTFSIHADLKAALRQYPSKAPSSWKISAYPALPGAAPGGLGAGWGAARGPGRGLAGVWRRSEPRHPPAHQPTGDKRGGIGEWRAVTTIGMAS